MAGRAAAPVALRRCKTLANPAPTHSSTVPSWHCPADPAAHPPARPAEVDSDADIAAGRAPGAKRAAVRKLGHELGIPAQQLPLDKFKYLTRLHYCAADTGGAQELGVGWGRGGGLD